MAVFQVTLPRGRIWRSHGHLLPIILGLTIAACAVALVAYLLWPTWRTQNPGNPTQLPVSISGTLFNVPSAAVRMKIQRHSGPQERVDLHFAFPSLQPPAPQHVTAEMVEDAMPPIEEIFVSIAAHHDALSPEERVRTIYPRYLAETATTIEDGLIMRAFSQGTPYSGEDLFSADAPSFSARCTRDASTPGMCLSERRIGGADLTFRFPRGWLVQWRDVADAMDRLTVQLHGAK